MITFTAGRFTAEVRGPFPMWVEVKAAGSGLTSIRHDELADLRHVIDRATWAARQALRKSGDEGEVA